MTTEKKGKLEGAKKLKEMGMSNGDIKNATGLLDEEIESLQIKKKPLPVKQRLMNKGDCDGSVNIYF